MFVYELIGLFLRSLNIAFFILEECCAVPENDLKPPLSALRPMRKEQIYVTFSSSLRIRSPHNVEGEILILKVFQEVAFADSDMS